MISSRYQSLLAAVAVLVAGMHAVSAVAAVTYAGPFVGTDVTYTDVVESSADPIEDPEPLYGEPEVLAGNILDFDPSANAFAATSPPPDNTDGALTFVIESNTQSPIPTLIVRESGDYQFLGSVSGGETVAATTFVQVLDIATDAVLIQASDSFVDTFDNTPIEGGFWDNEVVINLAGIGNSAYKVIINNLLQATGSGSATASIRKKEFQVDVPEPAMFGLLAGGVLLAARRRG